MTVLSLCHLRGKLDGQGSHVPGSGLQALLFCTTLIQVCAMAAVRASGGGPATSPWRGPLCVMPKPLKTKGKEARKGKIKMPKRRHETIDIVPNKVYIMVKGEPYETK